MRNPTTRNNDDQLSYLVTESRIHAETILALQSDIERLTKCLNSLAKQFYVHIRDCPSVD